VPLAPHALRKLECGLVKWFLRVTISVELLKWCADKVTTVETRRSAIQKEEEEPQGKEERSRKGRRMQGKSKRCVWWGVRGGEEESVSRYFQRIHCLQIPPQDSPSPAGMQLCLRVRVVHNK
jgi:hypothetical protein